VIRSAHNGIQVTGHHNIIARPRYFGGAAVFRQVSRPAALPGRQREPVESC
jgi:hypothetical protein